MKALTAFFIVLGIVVGLFILIKIGLFFYISMNSNEVGFSETKIVIRDLRGSLVEGEKVGLLRYCEVGMGTKGMGLRTQLTDENGEVYFPAGDLGSVLFANQTRCYKHIMSMGSDFVNTNLGNDHIIDFDDSIEEITINK